MVEPISDGDRARTMLWVKAATVFLIAISAGLITTQGDTSLEIVVAAVAAGAVVGVVVVWYLFPDLEALAPASEYEYRE